MSLHHRILVTFIFLLLCGYDNKLQAASLTLSWSDKSNNEDGFRIERMVSGGVLAQIAKVGANVTSYSDANLTSGLNYCYVVRAFNSAGVSDASNAACAVALDSGTGGGTTQPGTDGGTTQPGTGGGTGNNSSGTITNLSNDPVDGRSTRGVVVTGDNVMIAGFIISGESPKT